MSSARRDMFPCALALVIPLIVLTPSFAWSQLLTKVPNVVGEITEPIPFDAGHWSSIGDTRFETNQTPQRATVRVNYSNSESVTSEAGVQIRLREEHLIAERVRFWLKGDGSGNRLVLWLHHQQTGQWYGTPTIKLSFDTWRHFELPAPSPFHRFHRSADAIKLIVYGEADDSEIELGLPELVSYKPIDSPLERKDIPAPLFDTHGSPTAEQLKAGHEIGVNLHMTVVNWVDRGDPHTRVDYAARSLPWIRDARLMAGLSFYGNPSVEWARANPNMVVHRDGGHPYVGPGTFTSPWNPAARKLWRSHIRDCLLELRGKGVLQHVDLVELCPGEESEVSFNWEHVWAFDPHAISAYRAYLRRLYSNRIETLNADWASSYNSFDTIKPPALYYPDREHWVFADFYRFSMLRYCVFLADAVLEVHKPEYWLWMTHSVPSYPQRHNAARYPIFYAENLRRLGLLDYAQTVPMWQHPDDVRLMQSMGIKVIGELDIVPTPERLEQVFAESSETGMDGVFVGILEPHLDENGLTQLGEACRAHIARFRTKKPSD